MNRHIELVGKAIKAAGGQKAVAVECGVTQPAVFKWTKVGLPRTEWLGKTSYAKQLEQMTKGEYTRAELLEPCDPPKRASPSVNG